MTMRNWMKLPFDLFGPPGTTSQITLLRVIPTVAFYLAYILAVYLAFILTFYLAFYLAFYVTFFLAFYLVFFLVFFLAFYLVFFLAFYLAFYLAYILTSILRSREVPGWGPAVPTGLERSPVEVQQCPLISGDGCWGPAVPTAIRSWRGGEEARRRRRRRRRKARRAILKSNNPHPAGRKKSNAGVCRGYVSHGPILATP